MTLTKILSLDWAKVEEIVSRLKELLTQQEQDRILKILKDRRDQLGKSLGLGGE
jgi:hypothetical protein